MGFRTTRETDGVRVQYTAKEQRPVNIVRVDDRLIYEASHLDDVILTNADTSGAMTVKLYNPIIDVYLGTEDVYESSIKIRDEKGDAAANNIVIQDETGVSLATISTDGQTALFDIVNGSWVFVGRISL